MRPKVVKHITDFMNHNKTLGVVATNAMELHKIYIHCKTLQDNLAIMDNETVIKYVKKIQLYKNHRYKYGLLLNISELKSKPSLLQMWSRQRFIFIYFKIYIIMQIYQILMIFYNEITAQIVLDYSSEITLPPKIIQYLYKIQIKKGLTKPLSLNAKEYDDLQKQIMPFITSKYWTMTWFQHDAIIKKTMDSLELLDKDTTIDEWKELVLSLT
eukprot:359470_1